MDIGFIKTELKLYNVNISDDLINDIISKTETTDEMFIIFKIVYIYDYSKIFSNTAIKTFIKIYLGEHPELQLDEYEFAYVVMCKLASETKTYPDFVAKIEQ